MDTNTIKKITVVGPGMMGHAIAQEFAQRPGSRNPASGKRAGSSLF